jgi:YbbR domain-containing protein
MGLLTRNIGWKIFSLALAIGLWFAFVGETETAASVAVPVEYRNLPRGLDISNDLPDHLYLKVRGPAARVSTSEISQAAVVLDLSSIDRPGEQTFTLDQSSVKLPTGLTLTRSVPSQIRIQVENRDSREAPVEIRFAGPPPQGYRVASQSVTPPKLLVLGPRTHIARLAAVQADAIDLSGTVGTAEFHVSANVPDPQLRFDGSPMVAVRITLEKIPEQNH